MVVDELPTGLHAVVTEEIEPGEQIVWIDRPVPLISARGTIPSVLIAIPWTAMGVYLIAAAKGVGMRPFPARAGETVGLLGMMTVLMGLAMLSMPFWSMAKARGIVYVITNRRAIIIQKIWSTQIRSITPRHVKQFFRTQHSDGSGSIRFTHRTRPDSIIASPQMLVGFRGIRDVKDVERLLWELAERSV